MKFQSGRGGRREGSGRKAGVSYLDDSVRRQRFQIRLPGYLIEWIREQPESNGRLIEQALMSAYGEKIMKETEGWKQCISR